MHLSEVAGPWDSHPFPKPATLRVGDLRRDEGVASTELDAKRVAKLQAKFRPHLIGLPVVSLREDGSAVVLNGSHRVEMLRGLFGPDLSLDVLQFCGLTGEQESAIYERHHADRKKKSKRDKG